MEWQSMQVAHWCLTLQAKLPRGLWAKTVIAATFLQNRCPTKSLENKAPYEAWHNEKPYGETLRIAGSRIIALDKSKQRRIFDPKNHILARFRKLMGCHMKAISQELGHFLGGARMRHLGVWIRHFRIFSSGTVATIPRIRGGQAGFCKSFLISFLSGVTISFLLFPGSICDFEEGVGDVVGGGIGGGLEGNGVTSCNASIGTPGMILGVWLVCRIPLFATPLRTAPFGTAPPPQQSAVQRRRTQQRRAGSCRAPNSTKQPRLALLRVVPHREKPPLQQGTAEHSRALQSTAEHSRAWQCTECLHQHSRGHRSPSRSQQRAEDNPQHSSEQFYAADQNSRAQNITASIAENCRARHCTENNRQDNRAPQRTEYLGQHGGVMQCAADRNRARQSISCHWLHCKEHLCTVEKTAPNSTDTKAEHSSEQQITAQHSRAQYSAEYQQISFAVDSTALNKAATKAGHNRALPNTAEHTLYCALLSTPALCIALLRFAAVAMKFCAVRFRVLLFSDVVAVFVGGMLSRAVLICVIRCNLDLYRALLHSAVLCSAALRSAVVAVLFGAFLSKAVLIWSIRQSAVFYCARMQSAALCFALMRSAVMLMLFDAVLFIAELICAFQFYSAVYCAHLRSDVFTCALLLFVWLCCNGSAMRRCDVQICANLYNSMLFGAMQRSAVLSCDLMQSATL
ncbi:Copia protein [Eufriesea mexicana]|uniref:Copia protein n=1 Tax=Eufriesea mexicana TaxID=516756 RepID=A0A310SY16_9HYME|nr:Copia protein [Eufriesea mexicana]